MADNDSLLGFIAQRHTIGLEDVATDALCFILSRSPSARQALSDFLKDDCGPLPIAKAQSWMPDAFGAIPDLACYDENDNLVALIESKFWAALTHNQPVTYWQGPPKDRPAVLLFLAPDYRVNEGSLWNELVDRLRDAGHELDPAADRKESLIAARAKCGQRRLMLTSWKLLLDRMAQRSKEDCDPQAHFEIAELQGLAASAIAGDKPQRDENLKRLIADAVKRVRESGWANTDGLTVGQGFDYYGRYLTLAGASAWLGICYKTLEQMPDKPLWLSFYRSKSAASVSVEEIRDRLGDLAEPGLEWYWGEVSVPIDLPAGADRDATLNAIVAQLEDIAKLIDPSGPTYREKRRLPAKTDLPLDRSRHAAVGVGDKVEGMTRVVCWNIARRHQPWRELVAMDADVALLQEAGNPPADVVDDIDTGPMEHWDSHVWNSDWYKDRWPRLFDRWPKIVKLSDRVEVEWFKQISTISEAAADEIAVSGIGTIAAARVTPLESDTEPFIAVSMYARWIMPHVSTGSKFKVGTSDGSAHRIISDLSAFIGDFDPSSHRILAAGDLNMVYGSIPDDPQELTTRDGTVFDRFKTLGMEFMGPQYPGGRQAHPTPHGLPPDTQNVPTFYPTSHQLDYVFASRGFHESIAVCALNSVDDWGSSDHCRLQIDVA
ncbi:MAG: hypothetical protein OXG11_10285 [Chloroflexi bacterium]|nr:hypothetical protein [Chloroflexota bacterium]